VLSGRDDIRTIEPNRKPTPVVYRLNWWLRKRGSFFRRLSRGMKLCCKRDFGLRNNGGWVASIESSLTVIRASYRTKDALHTQRVARVSQDISEQRVNRGS
jgi:hypothetical protein